MLEDTLQPDKKYQTFFFSFPSFLISMLLRHTFSVVFFFVDFSRIDFKTTSAAIGNFERKHFSANIKSSIKVKIQKQKIENVQQGKREIFTLLQKQTCPSFPSKAIDNEIRWCSLIDDIDLDRNVDANQSQTIKRDQGCWRKFAWNFTRFCHPKNRNNRKINWAEIIRNFVYRLGYHKNVNKFG